MIEIVVELVIKTICFVVVIVASESPQERVRIFEDCLNSILIILQSLHNGVGLRMMFWHDE